jgi:hypothetical protein
MALAHPLNWWAPYVIYACCRWEITESFLKHGDGPLFKDVLDQYRQQTVGLTNAANLLRTSKSLLKSFMGIGKTGVIGSWKGYAFFAHYSVPLASLVKMAVDDISRLNTYVSSLNPPSSGPNLLLCGKITAICLTGYIRCTKVRVRLKLIS